MVSGAARRWTGCRRGLSHLSHRAAEHFITFRPNLVDVSSGRGVSLESAWRERPPTRERSRRWPFKNGDVHSQNWACGAKIFRAAGS